VDNLDEIENISESEEEDEEDDIEEDEIVAAADDVNQPSPGNDCSHASCLCDLPIAYQHVYSLRAVTT